MNAVDRARNELLIAELSVADQKTLVAELQAKGYPAELDQELLVILMENLKIKRAHLDDLLKQRTLGEDKK